MITIVLDKLVTIKLTNVHLGHNAWSLFVLGAEQLRLFMIFYFQKGLQHQERGGAGGERDGPDDCPLCHGSPLHALKVWEKETSLNKMTVFTCCS